MGNWPECQNCENPAAEYKNRPGKPRLYCSDQCSEEYSMYYKSFGGRKNVRSLAPHWPMCLHCNERPRALWDNHQDQMTREPGKEYRESKRAAEEAGVPFEPPTLLFKFCSTDCRETYLAPYKAFVQHFYEADNLASFK
ncbi:MAG: hypothetical protein JWR78_919 [Mycobacterium sp.]|nr:hypothetical protein [Mycobacterium sp.]